jgi:hypothetical protein
MPDPRVDVLERKVAHLEKVTDGLRLCVKTLTDTLIKLMCGCEHQREEKTDA